jgi:Mrp family chromosome partitioning ATPase
MVVSKEYGERIVTAIAQSHGTGVLVSEPACPDAVRKAYDQAFLNVKYELMATGGTSIMVSAIDASASACTVAVNLAILAAKDGESVVLIDGDPHTPSLESLFSLTAPLGFKNLVQEESPDFVAALNALPDVPGLHLIGAGTGTPIPGGIGRAKHLHEVLVQLKKSVDRLIVVGAPILEQVDGLDLARLVDGVVIAVTPGKTHRLDAARARELLDRVKAPLVGVVLTGKPI